MKKLLSLMVISLLISGSAFADYCRSSYQISNRADDVAFQTRTLAQEIRYEFGEIRLLEDVRRVRQAAKHLARLARSGGYRCHVLKSNFASLSRVNYTLRQNFSSFSRRRDVRRVAYEWRNFVDTFESLRRTVQMARDRQGYPYP